MGAIVSYCTEVDRASLDMESQITTRVNGKSIRSIKTEDERDSEGRMNA